MVAGPGYLGTYAYHKEQALAMRPNASVMGNLGGR